jgi:hypothetical protein
LLLSIDPTGKNDQHQLPRLQNEFHRRLGGSENPRGSLVRNEIKTWVGKRESNRSLPAFRLERSQKHCRRRHAFQFG